MYNSVAITMVKNEIDIIGRSIENMLDQNVDQIIVADNMSTDGTYEYLKDMDWSGVEVVLDQEVAYYQSRKMTDLGHMAHEKYHADWVVPFDADELFYHQRGPLSEILREETGDIMFGVVWHQVATNDAPEIDPVINMRYRRSAPEKFPNVVYRYHPDAVLLQGNHGIDHPGILCDQGFEVRHYQYRSFKQFKNKVLTGKKAYDATDLPEGEGFHWRSMGGMQDGDLLRIWNEMKNEKELVFDPWQE